MGCNYVIKDPVLQKILKTSEISFDGDPISSKKSMEDFINNEGSDGLLAIRGELSEDYIKDMLNSTDGFIVRLATDYLATTTMIQESNESKVRNIVDNKLDINSIWTQEIKNSITKYILDNNITLTKEGLLNINSNQASDIDNMIYEMMVSEFGDESEENSGIFDKSTDNQDNMNENYCK